MKYCFLLLSMLFWSVASAITLSPASLDTVTPGAGSPTCDNVTNPGKICCAQTICAGTRPLAITNLQAPTGGSGTLIYWWFYLDMHVSPPAWQFVPNEMGADYQPDTLYETQYYQREVRREGCELAYLSDLILIEVLPATDSLCAVSATSNPLSITPLLTMAPNPCRDKVTLHNTAAVFLTVYLFRIDGQFVRTLPMPAGTSLDMATTDLAAGLYYLQAVQPDGRQWITKLVKTAF